MDVRFVLLLTERPIPSKYYDMDIELSDDTKVRLSGDLKSYFAEGHQNIWDKWLGTIVWENLENSSMHLLSFAELGDGSRDDQFLVDKVIMKAWPSFLASFPWQIQSDRPTVMTGIGSMVNGWVKIRDIDSVTSIDSWVPSRFVSRRASYTALVNKFGDLGIRHWREIFRTLETLERGHPNNHTLYMSLEILRETLSSSWPDIRFPNFVRVSECVLAIPRNANPKVEFIKRTSFILMKLGFKKSHVRAIEKHLAIIYQIRNDCFHGKKIDSTLRDLIKGNFERYSQQLEFIAELVARASILFLITEKEFLLAAASREELEKKWEEKVQLTPMKEVQTFLAQLAKA